VEGSNRRRRGPGAILFRAAILLCVCFEETIRAEGMTLKLLERRLNNNSEPYKGEDCQLFKGGDSSLMSMSRFVRQTFEHIHKHKGTPNARVRGSDFKLQDLLLISPFIFDNLFQRQVESFQRQVESYELTYYPGGKCDSAAYKGDCSRLWYINTWVMKWSLSQTE
jgi:hypothetical protein